MLNKDKVVAFKRMMRKANELAMNVQGVDSSSEFIRNVTLFIIEVPNELLEQYGQQKESP